MAVRVAGTLLLQATYIVCGQIQVLSPADLVQKFSATHGRIQGSTATFGAPFYGDKVFGRLVYGESLHGKTYCEADDYEIPTPSVDGAGAVAQVRLINIVILRRGKCSFVTKVRIAAEKNAHAVIIVDKENSDITAKALEQIVVADDGFGDSISIPSILVTKEDGAVLINAAKNPVAPPVVELSWIIPTNHVVTVDLWMSSASRESQKFLKDFAPKRKTLNEVVNFQPHFAVYSYPGQIQAYQDLCMDHEGILCAEDPDGAGVVTGKDVLLEDVRQLCIHESTKVLRDNEFSLKDGKQNEYAAKFWDYVEKMFDRCPVEGTVEEKRFGDKCSEKLMHEVGLDVMQIQNCVATTSTTKLKHERDNPAWSPRALRINGWRYKGWLDADLVTRAICSGFVEQPAECEKLLKKRDPTVRYIGSKGPPPGVSFRTFILVILAAVGIASVAGLMYKRNLKQSVRTVLREEVMLEVQAQIGEYKQLNH